MRIKRIVGIFVLMCCASGASASEPNGIATGKQGMVVSTHYRATQIGVDILRKGGNAVDAAIAVGYALAVVHPSAGNIGGGGFMLIRFRDGTAHFIDFRERAPSAATATMYQDLSGNVIPNLSQTGYLAAGIPGTVRGFDHALTHYGSMQWKDLIEPAIALAENGFNLRDGDVENIAVAANDLAADPEAAHIFLVEGRKAPKVGSVLKQPDLAQSLRLIADNGANAFYQGPIADKIAAASAAHHGILTRDDFANYKVRQHDPVQCRYRGYDVITAPPPSSGGVTICEILNILEGYDLGKMGFHSAKSVHILAEAMRRGFYDRNNRLGDPEFVENPIRHLTDKAYATSLRAGILPDHATPSAELGANEAEKEGKHTTDYMVIDKDGTAVSVVYTLNDWFGAKVVATGTGIVLNDEMDDFTAKPGVAHGDGLVTGTSNAIAPGKSPLSSMSPTILSQGGKTVMLTGSFGSGTIITSVLQVIVNLVDYRMSAQDAVNAPRIHQQWLPDDLAYDEGALSPNVMEKLKEMGYLLTKGTIAGATETILVGGNRLNKPTPNHYVGVNDRRAPVGAAMGYE